VKRWRAGLLRSPEQLPDLSGDQMTLIWDTDQDTQEIIIRTEYSRNHLVPVLIDAGSIPLDSNPLGGSRRATDLRKSAGGIFGGSEDFFDSAAQQSRKCGISFHLGVMLGQKSINGPGFSAQYFKESWKLR
jgi:hypothetical protein